MREPDGIRGRSSIQVEREMPSTAHVIERVCSMKYGDGDCAPHSINCESIGTERQLEVDLEFGQDSRIQATAAITMLLSVMSRAASSWTRELAVIR